MAELFIQGRSENCYRERKTFTAREYRKLFRFEKESVEWLAKHFLDEPVDTRRGALSSVQKMEILIRSLADSSCQIGVANDTGVHQSTVSRIINYVTTKIYETQNFWIRFPHTMDEIHRAEEHWSIPNVIGAVDCVHIGIVKPTAQAQEYFNKQGYFSINVQATCSSTEWFTSVVASWPGSVHDSIIWKNSDVCRIMTENIHNVSLLGDGAYDLTPWLLTPFRNAANEAERNYNRLHQNNRGVIESCFGQLKRRFPMMHSTVRLKNSKVYQYIVCGFVLHNVAKYLNDPDDDFDEIHIEQDPVYNQNKESQNVVRQKGIIYRNAVAAELLKLRKRRNV